MDTFLRWERLEGHSNNNKVCYKVSQTISFQFNIKTFNYNI